MNEIIIQKSNKGWIIELPDDFSEEIGVEKGSIALLSGSNGKVETEIIPPPSEELKDISKRITAKYKEAFAEIKRLGD
jgi:DNA-directed RNA polymerase specialized sigma54-like protein